MLITNEYLIQQKILHENPNYGVASLAFGPIVELLIQKYEIKTITDYGAGKCNLKRYVKGALYQPYDPVFPEYGPASPADLVCCIDVLEHIEEDCLHDVLADLYRITNGIGFFSIHTGPAAKYLHDGRNAHLIQAPANWWLPHICRYFKVHKLQEHSLLGSGFWIIVSRSDIC